MFQNGKLFRNLIKHKFSSVANIFFLHFQFRNQYDNDVTTWSPQGRLHQVEYAMEAVKQGSATVGVKSKNHAVLVALKRASSELSAYQKKIMNLDDHMGMSIAGLTADAKRWVNFHKWSLFANFNVICDFSV